MKLGKLKKIIAGSLAIASILAMNPIGANAAWKQNSTGWWYTEGNSWATGWRLIDGNWHYFYSNGYMAHDTTIDGYYLNSNGAWSDIPAYNCESTVTISGTVRKSTWQHMNTEFYPNPTPYYYLELDTPLSVVNSGYESDEPFRNQTEIQLLLSNDYYTSKVNQHITITGIIDVSRFTQYYQRNLFLK